jgi:hypothetical protein
VRQREIPMTHNASAMHIRVFIGAGSGGLDPSARAGRGGETPNRSKRAADPWGQRPGPVLPLERRLRLEGDCGAVEPAMGNES